MARSWGRVVCNGLLVVCLLYISVGWITSPSQPALDKIIYKFSLGNGKAVYGARDNRGGATVGFSYRFYTLKDMSSDGEVLKELSARHPFLITKDPDVSVATKNGELHIYIRGRVYEFSSYSLEAMGFSKVEMVL